MNLLNKLTIKNLKLNKKRTVVTIIGIILSVALITAVSSMFFSAQASLIKFETSEKGNYHCAFKDVLKNDLKYFEKNQKIEQFYLTENIGYAHLKESKNTYKPYIFVKAFDKLALKNLGVNIVEGRLPENESEIIIPTHLKTNGRVELKIGDEITLDVGTRTTDNENLTQNNPFNPSVPEEIINTKKITYKIVGISTRPTSSIEPYSAPGYTFITYLNENNLNSTIDIYTRYTKKALKKHYYVTANIIGVDPDKYAKLYDINESLTQEEWKEITNELEKSKYQVDLNNYLIMLESGLMKDSTTQALGMIVLVVIIIIIFTSVFCIKNSFDISITEKTKQYGMLSSIGATRKQIKKNVYYEAFILGLIGVPLGILCGLIASYILIIISNYLLKDMMNISLIYKISLVAIIFAIILGFLTLFLSAWKSAHKASKISPINAIRNSNDIKIKSKKIKSPKYIKKIFGIGGDVSYKNIKRNRKKYRTTIISIIVCVSVFIALSSFINLAFRVVEEQFTSTDYNLILDYDQTSNKDIKDKVYEILSFDNIKDYSITANSSLYKYDTEIKFSKDYLNIHPDANEKKVEYEYTDESGNTIKRYTTTRFLIYRVGDHAYKKYLKELNLDYNEVKDKGILMNYIKETTPKEKKSNEVITKTIPVTNYKKGDTIKLFDDYSKEDSENNEHNFDIKIASLTDKLPFGVVNYSEELILIVSDDVYNKYFNNNQNHENIRIYSNNASKLQDEIDKHLVDYEYSLQNIEEEVRMMKSLYTLVAIFLYGFITVIALIGVTNIFNTITTNMELRSREFATLKSIGMTKKEFNRMISLESFFYGTKSLLIGIPIGIALSLLINNLLNNGSIYFKYQLPLNAIIISIIAVFILITCIMHFSITKINKQNTIETIRNENI